MQLNDDTVVTLDLVRTAVPKDQLGAAVPKA
jgi:hypothetical protein